MGEACSRIPIPAVTFMHNTTHSSQNCGVPKAVFTSTSCVVTRALGLAGATQPSGFHPGCGNADREDAEHHGNKIESAHHQEGLFHAQIVTGCAEVGHKIVGQRSADKSATAKTHDGHASRHARAIREPFDQRGNRRNIAEAKTNAANHAVAQIDEPELVSLDAKGGNEETAGRNR